MQKLNTLVGSDGSVQYVADADLPAFHQEAQANGLTFEPARSFSDDKGNILPAVADSDLPAFQVEAESNGIKVHPVQHVLLNGEHVPVLEKDRAAFVKEYQTADPESPMGKDKEAVLVQAAKQSKESTLATLAKIEPQIQRISEATAAKPAETAIGAVGDVGRDLFAGVWTALGPETARNLGNVLKMAGATETGGNIVRAMDEQRQDSSLARAKGAGLAGSLAFGAGRISGNILPMALPGGAAVKAIGWLPMVASVTGLGQQTFDNLVATGMNRSKARGYAAGQVGLATIPMLLASRFGASDAVQKMSAAVIAGMSKNAIQEFGRKVLAHFIKNSATWTVAGTVQGAGASELRKVSGEEPDAAVALDAVKGALGNFGGAMGFEVPKGIRQILELKRAQKEYGRMGTEAEARSAAAEARRGAEVGPQATAAEIAAERPVAPPGPRAGLVAAIERGQAGERAQADALQAERDLRTGGDDGAVEGGVSEPYRTQLAEPFQTGEEGALPAGYQHEPETPAPRPKTGSELLSEITAKAEALVKSGAKPGDALAQAASETSPTVPHESVAANHAADVLDLPAEDRPFRLPPRPEPGDPVRVIAPAIRGADGQPIIGTDHPSIIAETMPHLVEADVEAEAGEEGVMGGNVEAMRNSPYAGFMVEDANGNRRFASREEAMQVARRSGQVKPESRGERELHTDMMKSPDTPAGDGAAVQRFGGGTPRERAEETAAITAVSDPIQQAKDFRGFLRAMLSESALNVARMEEALTKMRSRFDRSAVSPFWRFKDGEPLPYNYRMIDAIERGDFSGLKPEVRTMAEQMHKQMMAWLDRLHAVDPQAIKDYIQNYFPHLWKNEKQAKVVLGQILGRRPLEGGKDFLKQRTIQLFSEGLAAGLRPLHDNPVDLWLARAKSVEQYIMAQKVRQYADARGMTHFVSLGGASTEGWRRPKDSSFTVYAPPTEKVTEWIDKAVYDGLNRFAASLGIRHVRGKVERDASGNIVAPKVKGLGRALGYSITGGNEIHTNIGTETSVLAHEIGHQLDERYNLWENLLKRDSGEGHKPGRSELRAIADLTGRGKAARSPAEKIAQMVEIYVHAPGDMLEAAPRIYNWFDNFIKTTPELSALADIHPGIELTKVVSEQNKFGLTEVGHYEMPEPVTQIMDNYLSPGLSRFMAYRAVRQASMSLSGIQLMGGFHLGFTTADVLASNQALALRYLAEGRPLKGLGMALGAVYRALPLPLPGTNIMQGAKYRDAMLHPEKYAEDVLIAQALEQAGVRTKVDDFWQAQVTRHMVRAFSQGPSGWVQTPFLAPFAIAEQMMRPILEYIVPRQKIGVMADMARFELDRLGPNATGEAKRAALQKAYDSVENRMGQMTYDNINMNRTVKDLGLLGFRAFGWQLGKFRELGGGVGDYALAAKQLATTGRFEMTHRMAYVPAMVMTYGAIGGLLTYLMTGKGAQTYQDYFQPPTGEKDANGNPVRMNLPGYLKDLIGYYKHPVETVSHSLNPLLSPIIDLLQNKDFYGVEIHSQDPNVNWGVKAMQDLAFAGKSMVPFSVTGEAKLKDEGATGIKRIGPYFGVTPMPVRMAMTPAQAEAAAITASGFSNKARSHEEFERSQIMAKVMSLDRVGRHEEAMDALQAGVASGMVGKAGYTALGKRLQLTPLQWQVKHMSPEDEGYRVWRLANDGEKAALQPILAARMQAKYSSINTLPGERETIKRVYADVADWKAPEPAAQ